ncbi:MAG: hypothetical protein OXM56_02980, partial [Gammaproteobacteria bacterium]|nr:hypothetical protein [Gammaproteobacteria bacterium]
AGELLLAAGEPVDLLQLVTGGSAAVRDEAGARVRMVGPGEPVAGQLPSSAVASASVVAETACTTAALSASALGLLEESDRDLAVQVYRYLLDPASKRSGRGAAGGGGAGRERE